MMDFRVVDFPNPFLPRRATVSPLSMLRETSLRMWLFP